MAMARLYISIASVSLPDRYRAFPCSFTILTLSLTLPLSVAISSPSSSCCCETHMGTVLPSSSGHTSDAKVLGLVGKCGLGFLFISLILLKMPG